MLDRKIRYCSLPEALREHFLWGARPVVVAGTHGKTTTTSLVGWLLTHGGLDPTVFVGGIALNFGEAGSSYRLGQGREFVIEGDEYDSAFFDKTAKFLKYLPDIAIINNIEFDHADIYPDLDAVRLAFRRLALLVPRSGCCSSAPTVPTLAALAERAVSPVETFGLSEQADWRARSLDGRRDRPHFTVSHRRRWSAASSCRCSARTTCGTPWAPSRPGRRRDPVGHARRRAARFRGVKRRLEVVGRVNGVTVYDDFAHHPTAVAETIAAVRARASRAARLGRVRAALRVVVPPRVPGRFREGVRGGRRDGARARLPLHAAGAGAALGRAARRRPPRGGGRPVTSTRSTASSRRSSPSAARATSC